VIAAAWRTPDSLHPAAPITLARLDVEVELDVDVDRAPASAAGHQVAPPPSAASVGSSRALRASLDPPAVASVDATLEPGTPPEAPENSDGPAPRPRVNLGLDGSIVGRIVLDARKAPTPRTHARPTSGLDLGGELNALDAAKGHGRSSTTIAAARTAARVAPPFGSATFDVRADASGRVVSVVLLSFGSDGAEWQRVRAALQRELQRRRVRVPSGAKGLSAVLRIERGELALENRDRGRTKRGVAIGQDSLGPKEVKDESTRASMESGGVAPALGVGPDTGSTTPTTRVVLVRERPL
jgi:hypothetical protein